MTDYEMPISYWSSDVVSSDLVAGRSALVPNFASGSRPVVRLAGHDRPVQRFGICIGHHQQRARSRVGGDRLGQTTIVPANGQLLRRLQFSLVHPVRSEEHTSELQSLMRISYAVFCLKKKRKNTSHQATD